jgi:putative peptide zinc metalloprotease protein
MASKRKTFSEHWHTVAGQKVWLLPTVRVRRQQFEGGRWHVVEDPLRGRFFRLHPAAYAMVARLSPDRTVAEVWEAVVAAYPETAPTQPEVIQLLGQLHAAGLLRGELPADSKRLLERDQKARGKQLRSQLASLSSFTVRLFNPDSLLRGMAPLGRLAFGWPGLVVWLVVVGSGMKVALDHWPELVARGAGALAPENLVLLGLVFTGVKIIHELGHGLACRRFGGEVRETGLMVMFLAPFPYIDTTSSWAMRERSKRILVAAAGMLFELFVAALAVMVWAHAGHAGSKGLAYNVIFVASVTTVLFNGNPLLRYDAYYMLSDWLRVPNLMQRSNLMLGYLCEKQLFGMAGAVSPAMTPREAWILAWFGVIANVYRIALFSSLIVWIAGEYLILGLLMALAAGWGLIGKPVVSLVRYLATSERLGRHRPRAIAVTVAGLGGVLALLGLVPAPRAFRAPGVVESRSPAWVHTEVAGVLAQVVVPSGRPVASGDLLLRFENPELAWEVLAAMARKDEVLAEWRAAEDRGDIDVAPYQAALAAAERDLELLDMKSAGLAIRAPVAGIWDAPEIAHHAGRWVAKGEQVGRVIGAEGRVFRAVVRESDAAHFFAQAASNAEVRLHGETGHVLNAESWHLVPAYREELPSAALGWEAGGEVETRPTQQGLPRATEPFFEVRAALTTPGPMLPAHGRTGVIRFQVPAEPYLRQWLTTLRRFLQKKYRL